MADEDPQSAAQNLAPNLLEEIQTIQDTIRKKRNHLEEVTEKSHNEARQLKEILSKLRDLEDKFNDGEKIKDEFVEFCNLIASRSDDVTEKLEKLDTILETIRKVEEDGSSFEDRAQGMDLEASSTSKGNQEFLDLKQEVDDWNENLRQRFKDAKKRKLSLISKLNVEDVNRLFTAWSKASEVEREYSEMIALMKKDMASNEQSLKAEMKRTEATTEEIGRAHV